MWFSRVVCYVSCSALLYIMQAGFCCRHLHPFDAVILVCCSMTFERDKIAGEMTADIGLRLLLIQQHFPQKRTVQARVSC